MILYFANRKMDILGIAATELPGSYVILSDKKIEDVDSGVSSFECKIGFNKSNRSTLEKMTQVGNYLLRSNDTGQFKKKYSYNENEFFTIIDTEIDTKKQVIYIYAEDAGLDLLNEIAPAYEATETHTSDWYINKYIKDSGFTIGINEIPDYNTRKLSWDGESSVTERLASIATQFGGYELSYTFKVKGLQVVNKYVNIFEQRGSDIGVQLRLNRDIDNIVVKKTVANLATAFMCTGGTPEDSEEPITLKGYKYDDGDFYVGDTGVLNGVLMSRKSVEKWSRYVWAKEPNQITGYDGHIIKTYSYETLSQKTLCSHAISELKKVCDMEVNYEADIKNLPDNIKVGDRVYIIDDAGQLYLSSRLLQIETSVIDDSKTVILGETIIKRDGIAKEVKALAKQFVTNSKKASKAIVLSNNAKAESESAKAEAAAANAFAVSAKTYAESAQAKAEAAEQSSASAQEKAQSAQEAVESVSHNVSVIETTVSNAQTAADNAQAAAVTASNKADQAAENAQNALTQAEAAKTAADSATVSSQEAVEKAEQVTATAAEAKTAAQEASATAAAAKADAEQAASDIDALGQDLETTKTTMSTDYARKTELTEATANLQTQITQNSAEISSTASKLVTIDETANSAAEQAENAQNIAATAQQQAADAISSAGAAQTEADNAKTAAAAAQAEATNAANAAATAQSVANKADADLTKAKADLESVTSRVDATEAEIESAQTAVTIAQEAADKAKTDAASAAAKAATAQTKADTAAENAASAQTAADKAAEKATLAQKVADEATGSAAAAQASADNADKKAAAAQSLAQAAQSTAETAQTKANEAADTAAAAQTAANEASNKANQAQTELDTAKANLEAVKAKTDSTAEEVAAAQAAVDIAQAAADAAKADATAAQATADEAKANAETAQAAANTAKNAADAAQAAADSAQAAADKAQGDVDALEVRVINAETSITQNADAIELAATKTEVVETLGGYYTKEETDSQFTVTSESILSEVSAVSTKTTENGTEISRVKTSIEQAVDMIKNLVRGKDGESLMTQTDDGFQFDFATFQEEINKSSELLAKYDDRIKLGTYEGEPCIEFSESSTDFKVVITNKRILFFEGSSTPTYIFENTLHTENIEVKDEIKQGGFAWKVRENGNYGLMWKGAES